MNLLCVANNGYAGRPEIDRKGFRIAIEAAMALDMPITIGGPKNNEKFFATLPSELNNYSKLTKVFDLNESQLIDLYNSHSIFLHFSELEAGHPNLTLLEAMSCGLPIVGTFEEKHYDGMIVTERSLESAINGIKNMVANFQTMKENAINNAQKNCYSNRVRDLVDLYSEYREKIFADRLANSYKETKKHEFLNKIFISFLDGAKVEINGNHKAQYIVRFKESDTGSVIYETEISNNMWCSPRRRFFTEWSVEVYEKIHDKNIKLVASKTLNLKNKNVLLNVETTSLGDLLAYTEVINRFQKKHECLVDCVFLNKELISSLQPNYKNIRFVTSSDTGVSYYASYNIGYFMDSWQDRVSVDPKTVKLNYVPSYILGLNHTQERPKLSFKNDKTTNKKYVCIATQSTSQCKYWNNKDGWKTLIKYLNKKGYDVWCIDKNHTFGNQIMNSIPEGAIDKTGDLPLETRMAQIYNAEFFIGLGSGLSWLAWAVGKPVVLISGFSKPFAEFDTPYRIINEKVCNGCWNNPNHTFDKGNWMWCPEAKDFECTKSITAEMVIEKINTLL